MKSFIWALITLVLSVWLGLQVAKDPGVAFFSYRHWSVTMPLWFACVSLIGLLFVFYGTWRLSQTIDYSLYRWSDWRRWQRQRQSSDRTNRGLIELIEGRWHRAEHYLMANIAQSDTPLLNYLALAKAAHEQKHYEQRDHYLRKAQTAAPHADIAVGLVQAQLQLSQGQLEQALANVKRLLELAPQNTLALKLSLQLYTQLGDWENLLKILPDLYRSKALTAEQQDKIEKNLYKELLKSTARQDKNPAALEQTWHRVPRRLKKDPGLIACYVQQLIHCSAPQEAIENIMAKVRQPWGRDLLRLYGSLHLSSPAKQLARAEGWLNECPERSLCPLLLLVLGQMAVRCQLWGKARHYFAESLRLEASTEAYLEQGKLLEQLKEMEAALQSYRNGVTLAGEQA
jgi:HemY protein